MPDWLDIARKLAGAETLETLVGAFNQALKDGFDVAESHFIRLTSDGRRLVCMHDESLIWGANDFNSPFAHALNNHEQKMISAEQLVYWCSDLALFSLLGPVNSHDKLLITPVSYPKNGLGSQTLIGLSVCVIEQAQWECEQWQKVWDTHYLRFVDLLSLQYEKWYWLEHASEAKGRLKESLSMIERKQVLMDKSDSLKQELVGESAHMKQLRHQIATASQSNMTVLIQGETGVGKDVVAQAVHRQSSRRDVELVAVNCAAIPETLLESELFGYTKGAFSGAESDKPGLIALANGGTLFLDEIGDMPLELQAKLLRVLETRQYRPLGAKEELTSDFRLIAATHVALKQKVENKSFRQDLFYRLYQFPIYVPSLKEREEDVLDLVKHFIQLFNQENDANVVGVDFEAMDALTHYSFPGNVRELKNMIELGCTYTKSGEQLSYRNLTQYLHRHDECETNEIPDGALREIADLRAAVRDYELKIISDRLTQFRGNRALTAKSLGIAKRTLADKCHKLEIAND